MVHDLGLFDAERLRAAATLAELGDNERAVDAFDELARDVILYHGDRVEAARALAELGDQRGGALLADMANGIPAKHFYSAPRWDAGGRVFARLSDQDATKPHIRLEVAVALAGLGDQRAADPLAELIRINTLGTSQRLSAAQALAGLGDPRGRDKLAELADDHTVNQYARQLAIDALAELA
jgi:HEAT repeat protein